MAIDEAVGALMIAGAAGVVLGLAVLGIILLMIDQEIPVVVGVPSIGLCFGLLALAVRPPHPIVPGVILVVALTLMAFFPYASSTLERVEMREVDIQRLERAHKSLQQRPENFAVYFEIARALYDHGFAAQAIAVASKTLNGLSTQIDPVKNRSLRDAFRQEEYTVKMWARLEGQKPEKRRSGPLRCPGCGTVNAPDNIGCGQCGLPYLLELARTTDMRPRILGKLVLGWTLLATFLVGSVALMLHLPAVFRIPAFLLCLGATGGLLWWLFRPTKVKG